MSDNQTFDGLGASPTLTLDPFAKEESKPAPAKEQPLWDDSVLSPEEQQSVYAAMNQSDSGTISPKQASSLKNLSGAALLTPARVTRVLTPAADGTELPTVKASPNTIPNNVSKKTRKTEKKIKLPWSSLYMFFPAEVTDAEVEQTIYDALDSYTRKKDCEGE